ncbi:M14 family zinc carboxypeptidase [Saccharopolyspora endophytica]|uniref:Peptidase M14 n=1 Tax=Saccharopolyspora endophytica TaxID=543886 RepID=A0ABS5DG22_9PSEU|nr:M14 family zinc carboxypeptidase [Saccharopolyspora endophytica]MBQ0925234.1 peptidase M14 [Saccharopolyspora endophytica]
MQRWQALAFAGVVVGTALVPATAGAPPTMAAPPPCSEEPRENPITEFTSYDEMLVELDRIERVSAGRVAVEDVGGSNKGRDMMLARVGTGPKVVFITAEIHGNEKTGPDALLDMLDYLGTSDSTTAQQIRDQLTVVAMPKINPDAGSLDRRGNDMTWQEVQSHFPQLAASPPPWNYITDQRQGDDYSQRPGFDVNRDYHPNLAYQPQPQDFPGSSDKPGWFISPETQTVRDVYTGLQAEFGAVDTYVDLHHQGACYTVPGTDEFVTMSLSGKFVADPNTPEGAAFAEFADSYRPEYSKQLNVAAYNALQSAAERNPDFGNITLYPQDINLPGTGLGAFQLNGSGAVLFEVRGQTQTLGEQHRDMLTRTVYIGLDGILSSLASGEVTELDPAAYDQIPPTDRGQRTLQGTTDIED